MQITQYLLFHGVAIKQLFFSLKIKTCICIQCMEIMLEYRRIEGIKISGAYLSKKLMEPELLLKTKIK